MKSSVLHTEKLCKIFGIAGPAVLDDAVILPVVMLVEIMGLITPRTTKDCTLHRICNRYNATVQICKKQAFLYQSCERALRKLSLKAFQIGIGKAVNIDIKQFIIHIKYHPGKTDW